MSRYNVIIEGIQPLLISNPASVLDNGGPKAIELPKREAEKQLYKCPDGRPGFPGYNLFTSLHEGAKGYGKIAGLSASKQIMANVQIVEEMVPIMPDGKWEILMSVVSQGRGRVPKARPLFREWSMTFHCDIYNDKVIIPSVLQTLWERAGRFSLGTWRQRFGKFRLLECSYVEV